MEVWRLPFSFDIAGGNAEHWTKKIYSTENGDQFYQELCFPNSTMTILYKGYNYTYNYVNGITNDSYDWMIHYK